ncbi:MAG: response regulator [Candidatus Spechtbacterales bacterium]
MPKQNNNSDTRTILVVEDDSFLSSLITTKLTKEGYRVIEAADGDAALAQVKEKDFDLILLDLILPGKSGTEVLKTLKETEGIKDVPVLVLTNLGEEDDIENITQLGAIDYMIKANFTPAEIAEKVKDIFENHGG